MEPLQRLSTDALTGLLSRGELLDQLEAGCCARWRHGSATTCAAMISLDGWATMRGSSCCVASATPRRRRPGEARGRPGLPDLPCRSGHGSGQMDQGQRRGADRLMTAPTQARMRRRKRRRKPHEAAQTCGPGDPRSPPLKATAWGAARAFTAPAAVISGGDTRGDQPRNRHQFGHAAAGLVGIKQRRPKPLQVRPLGLRHRRTAQFLLKAVLQLPGRDVQRRAQLGQTETPRQPGGHPLAGPRHQVAPAPDRDSLPEPEPELLLTLGPGAQRLTKQVGRLLRSSGPLAGDQRRLPDAVEQPLLHRTRASRGVRGLGAALEQSPESGSKGPQSLHLCRPPGCRRGETADPSLVPPASCAH